MAEGRVGERVGRWGRAGDPLAPDTSRGSEIVSGGFGRLGWDRRPNVSVGRVPGAEREWGSAPGGMGEAGSG
ncbi:hypothetical protein SAMN04488074_12673 [Lentzea albidocapillata subsp. violacea]|uniref:Uncharacterized protein n=1 Tax=Lentzea albidocapillata subsp. violacea TaxID=128104 RepID=A0A1G9VV34_9PSEU|nr:hypothetical protein SAMN04488074_12673 [Lentzea albidocapillata subsp. violacea]